MKKKLSSVLSSKIILILCVMLCAVFIGVSFFTDKLTTPLRNAISTVVIPVQKGMNYVGLLVADRYDTLQEIRTVLEENEDLKEQVDTLTEENNQLKQDTYELARLRTLYELDEKYPEYSKVAARVIGTTTDNWFRTFTVDKGSEEGIEVDMNVMADGGLVGVVTDVGPHYATVKTVIEDGSYISGMLIDTGDVCSVKGDIKLMDSGLVRLQYFKKDVVVRNGDKIVTSNISDKFLPGILIGYVKDVTNDSNNLTQSGYLVPAVDFQHLQEVLIIQKKKQNS